MTAPRRLRVNAFCPGLAREGPLSPNWVSWTTQERMHRVAPTLAFAEGPDERDWRDQRIGWGVVLPDNEALSPRERAEATELPPRVQEIIRERNGVVVRHRAELMPEKLTRYYDDGSRQDPRVAGGEFGIGRGCLPMYLVIVASPAQIPWKHQYAIASTRMVGRLALSCEALTRYFEHLATDWAGAAAKPLAPLLWSTDWGRDDITSLMRHAIAERVHRTYKTDATLCPRYLAQEDATAAKLVEALVERTPGMIVTTSHGRTSPLDNAVAMGNSIGVPIDQQQATLDIGALLGAWQPDGAIWYAHACCSAGADEQTSYAGLFERDHDVDRIVQGVSKVGSRVAPLPTALLSADKPVRAFIGHVEPTFDYPLQDPQTGQPLGGAFCDALTVKAYGARRYPIGAAFRGVQALAAQQFVMWDTARNAAQRATDAASRQQKREMALRAQLGGLDWQGVVILGDPTVAVPTG